MKLLLTLDQDDRSAATGVPQAPASLRCKARQEPIIAQPSG
ncbi:hypothetical protein PCAR4_350209 [Paraburkholderia caribensis]|nr:hypothetical protein PCAR4_350209 [Paraburkholderia caribensis]